MQTIENSKRKYHSRAAKIQILEELKTSDMTISNLARKHGVHPVTVHKWKREMAQNNNSEKYDISELLKEIEKIQKENDNLKKALGDISIENQIFKTANDILKKNQRLEKFKLRKKSSKR